jgi:hypothetical protein
MTGELICFVEAGERRLHLDRMPDLASALVCDRKELCRLALREFAPVLYAKFFAAVVPLEIPESISEYLETPRNSRRAPKPS